MDDNPLSEKDWKALPENKGKRYKAYRKAWFKAKHRENKEEVENVEVPQIVKEAVAKVAPPEEKSQIATVYGKYQEFQQQGREGLRRSLDMLVKQPPEIYSLVLDAYKNFVEAERVVGGVFENYKSETVLARDIISHHKKLDEKEAANEKANRAKLAEVEKPNEKKGGG